MSRRTRTQEDIAGAVEDHEVAIEATNNARRSRTIAAHHVISMGTTQTEMHQKSATRIHDAEALEAEDEVVIRDEVDVHPRRTPVKMVAIGHRISVIMIMLTTSVLMTGTMTEPQRALRATENSQKMISHISASSLNFDEPLSIN